MVQLKGLCVSAVLLTTSTAKAVSLVVMAVNTTAVPGDKVFTIGVQINEADLTAPGTQARPSLFVQGIIFGDGHAGPFQQSGLTNQATLQGAIAAGSTGGTQADDSLYRDSWWYSGSPLLSPNPGSDPNSVISAGAGTLNGGTGAGINLGPLGYTFSAFPVQPANVTSGQTMSFSGMYGPLGANSLADAPLINQFVNGELTLPLAQIVAAGNIAIAGDWEHGVGTGLIIGQDVYNVLGGPANIDPHAFLDFSTNAIESGNGSALPAGAGTNAVASPTDVPTAHGPEPSSLALAGLGALCLTIAARRRQRPGP